MGRDDVAVHPLGLLGVPFDEAEAVVDLAHRLGEALAVLPDHDLRMRGLPPLNALLTFEVVARTGSVRSVAGEMLVTLGAVSRQARLLEDYFGTPLCTR